MYTTLLLSSAQESKGRRHQRHRTRLTQVAFGGGGANARLFSFLLACSFGRRDVTTGIQTPDSQLPREHGNSSRSFLLLFVWFRFASIYGMYVYVAAAAAKLRLPRGLCYVDTLLLTLQLQSQAMDQVGTSLFSFPPSFSFPVYIILPPQLAPFPRTMIR